MKLDWERLNHVLIPVPTAARRRNRKPTSESVRRLVDLAFSLTPKGQVVLVIASLVGAIAIALPASRVPFFFGLTISLFSVSVGMRRRFRLDRGSRPSRVSLVSPSRATVGEALTVRVVVDTEEPPDTLTVRGPFLPWFARYENKPEALREDRTEKGVVSDTVVRFSRRADLHLGAFAVAKRMPFDLVTGPSLETEAFRVTIVPKPARLASLDLPGIADGTAREAGFRRGGSRDLAGVREYREGDRVRDLCARAWARTGIPHVREYDDPEEARAVVVVDTHGEEGDAFEAAMSVAAGVSETCLASGLALRLVVVGDAVHPFDIGRGREGRFTVLDALAVAEPSKVFDRARLEARVMPHLRGVSGVVLVTTKWDEDRAALMRKFSVHGAVPRVALVGDRRPATLPAYVRFVRPSEVASGGLAL